MSVTTISASRFELAPPRHFLLPAVLLLLSEEPSYGYNLVKSLNALRFGPVDRPSVYRTLAQLERDQLVESWTGPPTAGQERRVYGLTAKGDRALRTWMGVIKEERDALDRVLRRYAATGTPDAVLAEAEGEIGGPAALSPVASSTRLGPIFSVISRPEEHPWAQGPDHRRRAGADLPGRPRAVGGLDRGEIDRRARSRSEPSG